MSSTASQSRTEGAFAFPFSHAQVATAIATVLLTVAILSFRPLAGQSTDAGPGGDLVNQLGYGSLGALALFSMFSFVDRRVLSALLSPWWLLLVLFVVLSGLNAADPASAFRAIAFTLIGISIMAAVLTLPRDAEAFSTMLVVSGFVVVGLCYFGVVFMPHEAIHQPSATEPEHVGFWRGAFLHKNLAGPVMACFSFAGIYLYRRGRRRAGLLLFLAALIFMANTGSKTTAGLVPLSIVLVAAPGLIGMRLMAPLLFLLAVAVAAAATLGIVFVEPLKQVAQALVPDLTYTGRTTLWAFSGEMMLHRPWTGYGYDSFWGTPIVTRLDQFFDREWDIRRIVHGHNGYMDIAVTMGLPALAVAVMTFLVQPLRDYMRTPLRRENVFLSDFLLMITLFTSLNAFLESFFLRRVDPVWLFCVMGLLGLRLVARFPVATGRPPPAEREAGPGRASW